MGRYEKELVDLNNFIARKAHLEKELEDTRTDLLRLLTSTHACAKKISPHLLLPLFPPHPPPLPVPPTPRLHRFNQQHSADSIMLIALYYSSARCARDSRAAYSSQNGDRLRRAQQEELPRADFQNLWSKISQFVVIFA